MNNLLALKASAGSGKTFALTVRYLSLLFLGASPSSIIALTFTKKAANEMKERIFSTLVNLEEKEAELNQIAENLGKSKEEILNLRQNVKENFLQANLHVETIDAFFGKVLRKFALYLGIMPDFVTTDESHRGKLEELFIKRVSKDKKTFKSLVEFMNIEQRKLSNIFEIFMLLYEKSKELDFDAFKRISYPSDEMVLLKAKEICQLLKDLGASNRAVGTFDVNDIYELSGKSFWKLEELNNSTYKKYQTPQLDKEYLELKKLYKDFCIQKENYLLGEFFELFKIFEDVKFSLAKDTNELTFSDVALLTYKLLHESIDNDFLYFRMDDKIEHLLIDEFQDTNVVQFDILSPIVEEISSGIGVKNDRSFFYVGDTKQSIYRFRGGSKELFDFVAKKFNIKTQDLSVNYRSDGEVVDFVNEVFKPLFSQYVPQKIIHKNQGFVSVKTNDEILEQLNETIEELFENGVKQNDIAILCHTNSDVTNVKQSLINWDKNLNVSIESTTRLTQSNQVKILLEYLKFCYFGFEVNEKNTLVLLGRDFEQNLEEKIEDFSKPIEFTILKAIEILGLNGTDIDILRFIEIAREYKNIGDLLFELDRINEPSIATEELGIKVLTIHKSKGLEFKNVIVLDKLSRPNNKSGTFLYEYENERLRRIFYRMKSREFVDEDYKNAKEKEENLSYIDKLNAMYVAFTRAKSNLCIIKKQKSSVMDFLNLEDMQVGKISPSTKAKEAKKLHKFMPLKAYGLQKDKKIAHVDIDFSLEATYFGLGVHYLLELTSNFTEEGIKKAYIGLQNRYGNFVDTQKILKRVKNLIQNKTFLSLIKNGKLYKEQPLIYKGERKQLDLLISCEDKLIIIDYKTSNQVQEEHKAQVQGYKKALLNLQEKEVKAYLFYLRDEEIEIVEL